MAKKPLTPWRVFFLVLFGGLAVVIFVQLVFNTSHPTQEMKETIDYDFVPNPDIPSK